MSPRRASSTDVNGEAEQSDDVNVEGVCVCSQVFVFTVKIVHMCFGLILNLCI